MEMVCVGLFFHQKQQQRIREIRESNRDIFYLISLATCHTQQQQQNHERSLLSSSGNEIANSFFFSFLSKRTWACDTLYAVLNSNDKQLLLVFTNLVKTCSRFMSVLFHLRLGTLRCHRVSTVALLPELRPSKREDNQLMASL